MARGICTVHMKQKQSRGTELQDRAKIHVHGWGKLSAVEKIYEIWDWAAFEALCFGW